MAFGVVYIYTAESVPSRVRGTAVGFGSAMSRVGGMITPYATIALHNLDVGAPFWFFMATSAVGLLCSLMLDKVRTDIS